MSATKKRFEGCPCPFALATQLGPTADDERVTGSSGGDVQQPVLFSLEIAKPLGLVVCPSGWLAHPLPSLAELASQLEVSSRASPVANDPHIGPSSYPAARV